MKSYIVHGDLCPSDAKIYAYDGNIEWSKLLHIIERLNLTTSYIRINFDDGIDIDPAWRCSSNTTTKTTTTTRSWHYYYSYSKTYYLLSNGCLSTELHPSWSYRLFESLCATYRIKDYSSTENTASFSIYMPSTKTVFENCPANWLDVNKFCYRISNVQKTMQEAKASCITLSAIESSQKYQGNLIYMIDSENDTLNNYDGDDDDSYNGKGLMEKSKEYIKEYLFNMYFGEVVQYTSPFQARLGFFLLDISKVSDE